MSGSKANIVVHGLSGPAVQRVREAGEAIDADVIETPAEKEAHLFVDDEQTIAVVQATSVAGAEKSCVTMRCHAEYAHIPIFGVPDRRDDLSFVEIFTWGGDDLVALDSHEGLAKRLRQLKKKPPMPRASRRARDGFVIVAGDEPQWRTATGRTLFNGDFPVRFVSTTKQLLEEASQPGAQLIVASESLEDRDSVEACKQTREVALEVPWIIVVPPRKMPGTRERLGTLDRVAISDAFAPPENILFLANELIVKPGADARTSARLLYGSIVSFRQAGREEDEVGFAYNVSASGLYIRTLAPIEPGQDVWLEMWPPRCERRVRLAGIAAWRRPFGPNETATVPAGFGVKLTDGLAGDFDRYRAGYDAFHKDMVGTHARRDSLPINVVLSVVPPRA